MIDLRWVVLLLVALDAAILIALPHLAPRGIWFGVRTGDEFRRGAEGRAALRRYRAASGGALAVAAGAALAFGGRSEFALLAVGLGPLPAALAAYLANYFRLKPHALPAVDIREADLAPAAERLPLWTLLAAPPFALPAAAMLFLRENWERIPLRYPIHYGADGRPNGWAHRTERAVYAPLVFAEGLLLLILLLAVATLLFSRRSARRSGIPQVFVAVLYLLAGLFSGIGIDPVVHVSPAILLGAVLLFVVGLIVYASRRLSAPDAVAEPTPDDRWTLGGIYSNPDDPAIFVQKRIGYGYTVNFANPWSWAVMGGFFLGVAGLAAYLVWALK